MQKVEVQKTLISQSEDKVSWAAVITETRCIHPAQEGSKLDWYDYNRRQAIADANYFAIGDRLLELLGINEVLIKCWESVPSDQPPRQVAPPVPVQIRPPGPAAPKVPQPGPSTGATARPQGLPGPVAPRVPQPGPSTGATA